LLPLGEDHALQESAARILGTVGEITVDSFQCAFRLAIFQPLVDLGKVSAWSALRQRRDTAPERENGDADDDRKRVEIIVLYFLRGVRLHNSLKFYQEPAAIQNPSGVLKKTCPDSARPAACASARVSH
jgi:hypothetical protein